jgi:hypothetical protein
MAHIQCYFKVIVRYSVGLPDHTSSIHNRNLGKFLSQNFGHKWGQNFAIFDMLWNWPIELKLVILEFWIRHLIFCNWRWKLRVQVQGPDGCIYCQRCLGNTQHVLVRMHILQHIDGIPIIWFLPMNFETGYLRLRWEFLDEIKSIGIWIAGEK